MVGQLFSKDTQAIFYNWKEKPVQRMLDFDYVCGAGAVALGLWVSSRALDHQHRTGGVAR